MSPKAAPAPKGEQFSYDEMPYQSFPYAHTHPGHLAMIGKLFGVNTPKLETMKVLEIGSAAGGNIFPLALRYPKAAFHGIDLSQEQISQAEAQKKALGVKNITFAHQNIMDFDMVKNKGAYDYIICHGVYSWVPEEVSDRILKIFRECLSENGLALVSYNTLPGWNAVRSIREMMRFHSDRFPTAAEKVAQSRKLLDFLAETAKEGSSYKAAIEEERKTLKRMNDSYLYHDHLEGINRQFYFHQFVTSMKKHDLGYVGDTSLLSMFVENLNPKAMEALKVLNDLGMQEQYMDFVNNRRFRSSIVCRKEVQIQRNMKREQIMDYCLTANMQPEDPAADFKKPVKFVSKGGSGNFTTNNEITGRVYNEIAKSGNRPLAAEEAVARVAKAMPEVAPDRVRAALVESGLQLALRGFITMHSDSPAFASAVSEKPVALPLARFQAAQKGATGVTNALCGYVPISTLSTVVIPLLDGTRTQGDITQILVNMAMEGKITIKHKDEVLKDKAAITSKLTESVKNILTQLVKQALLAA